MANLSLQDLKGSLYDTSLPTLLIKKDNLYNKYPQIGFGDEGSVHRYKEFLALKIFVFIKAKYYKENKFKKIEEIAKIKDPSFCFPLGLVGFENELKEGYFMDLVITGDGLRTFDDLKGLKDIKKLIEYLLKGDTAIERIHKKGIIIGDIKGDNIIIDENGNPRFVDTDNYAYGDFDFDVFPDRRKRFKKIFGKDCSDADSDKFIYAMLCLTRLAPGIFFNISTTPKYLKVLVELLNVDPESRDILEAILSDAEDKPYIGPVLRKINPEQPLLDAVDINRLNRIY